MATHTFPALDTNNVFTGSDLFTNLGGVEHATAFVGSDIGAQINAAYAALPAAGGIILVPAGFYQFTTPILFTVNNKKVILQGAPHGGTTLQWNSSTGTAIQFDTGQSENFSYTDAHSTPQTVNSLPVGVGIRDIFLLGPVIGAWNKVLGSAFNGFLDSASNPITAIGIQFGSTNGSSGVAFYNVSISRFKMGIDVETPGIYIATFFSCEIDSCYYGLYSNSNSEGIAWNGGSISRNNYGLFVNASSPAHLFEGMSFDDNITNAIATVNSTIFALVTCVRCHFENGGGAPSQYINLPSGSSVLVMLSGELGDDRTTGGGTSADWCVLCGGYVSANAVFVNTGGYMLTAFNLTGTKSASLSLINFNTLKVTDYNHGDQSIITPYTGYIFNAPVWADVQHGAIQRIGKVAQGGLTGNLGLTTIHTPSQSGQYRVSAYAIITTAGGASSTLPALLVSYVDAQIDAGVAQTPAPFNTGNTTTTLTQGTAVINAAATFPIQVSTAGYASSGVPTMVYAVQFVIEALNGLQ